MVFVSTKEVQVWSLHVKCVTLVQNFSYLNQKPNSASSIHTIN